MSSRLFEFNRETVFARLTAAYCDPIYILGAPLFSLPITPVILSSALLVESFLLILLQQYTDMDKYENLGTIGEGYVNLNREGHGSTRSSWCASCVEPMGW